jgi:hypothetical protein
MNLVPFSNDLVNGYVFFRLDNFGAILGLLKSSVNGVYGEIADGIQQYYEQGDWILIQDSEVVKNLGTNISEWAEQSYTSCIPADKKSNDFLESVAKGSSYHMYVSNNTGEPVLARYLYTPEDENPWEIVFPSESPLQAEMLHQYCTKTFIQYFSAEDMAAKNYMEYIVSLVHSNKFGMTGKYESLESELSLSPIPLEAFLGKQPEVNPDEWTIEARLPCDCHAHEMSVWASYDYPFLEFGYWQHGKSEQPWSMKTRLKTVLDILATGNPYADMLILNRESAEKLRDTLNEFLDKTK